MREPNLQWRPSMKPETVEDWAEVQEVEKDICLLYHQLADYSYIMGDLYFGTVYSLPYWQYLNVEGLNDPQRKFIQDGCLVMILAMCWDAIDGSGAYISRYLNECFSAVHRLDAGDEPTTKLIQTVKLALGTVEKDNPVPKELGELSSWVHERYVRGYFASTSRAVGTNPRFKD